MIIGVILTGIEFFGVFVVECVWRKDNRNNGNLQSHVVNRQVTDKWIDGSKVVEVYLLPVHPLLNGKHLS